MIDWTTISALATAGGTLVLAAATFASVRSANRSARVAERSLQVGLRPLLMPSRLEDPMQKVRWVDEHWAHVDGNRASLEAVDGKIYLAMSVRNAGNGIAVLQAWHAEKAARGDHAPAREEFRPHMRDLYIPSGDIGFWQAALRDPDDDLYPVVRDALEQRQPLIIDVLYGDHEGGQPTISRFVVSAGRGEQWLSQVARHWRLDAPDLR